MKSIKRMFVSVIAFVMIFSMFSCIPFAASAEGETNWVLSFVQKVDGAYETVTSVEPGETYYLAVGVKDFSAIGEMTVAKDEYDAVDYTATAYDNTITAATVILDCSALGTVDATAIETPYASATVETNYADGQLRVIVWADKASGGLDYSIGQAELADNNGVLFYVPVTAGDTEGSASYTFNAGSSSAAASIATINKAAGTEFSALTHVASIAMGGYDVAYALSIVAAPEGPTYVEDLVIKAKNVAFAADYSMVFAVSADNYNAYDNLYIVAKKAIIADDGTVSYEETNLTEGVYTSANGGMYTFKFEGFAAREIATEVQATVYATDADGNVYYGDSLEYSMRSYAESRLSKSTSDYEKTMLVDFLNYGAAAQVYFGYNTNDLANKNLTEEQQALATAERTLVDSKTGTDDTSNTCAITNFNLIFKSKITIVAATNLTDANVEQYKDLWTAKITYTTFEGTAAEVDIPLNDEAQFGKQGGKWCVQYSGMKAREMDKVVSIAIYDNNGNQVSNTVTYSVETYAAGKLGSSTANLPELVKSMMKFGDSNAAYFANK